MLGLAVGMTLEGGHLAQHYSESQVVPFFLGLSALEKGAIEQHRDYLHKNYIEGKVARFERWSMASRVEPDSTGVITSTNDVAENFHRQTKQQYKIEQPGACSSKSNPNSAALASSFLLTQGTQSSGRLHFFPMRCCIAC